jgi:hypothetical protein
MRIIQYAFALVIFPTLASCSKDKEESESTTDDLPSHSTRSSNANRNDYVSDRKPNRDRERDNINDLPDSLRNTLQSPKPEWLQIGRDVSSDSVNVSSPKIAKPSNFQRGPFGSRLALELNGSSLTLGETWKQVSWVALNPSGSKVALQLANESQIRYVDSEGNVSSEGSALPMMNYDAERRWFFGSWQWISDNELIAPMNIQSTDGYSIVSSHLYIFDADTKTLSRVIVKDLNTITEESGMEIRNVSNRIVLLDIAGEFIEVTIPSEDSD